MRSAVAVTVIVLLAACGGSTQGSGVSARAQELQPGLSVLPDAPISERRNPIIVSGESFVFVWGGVTTSAGVQESFADGALFDRAEGTWAGLPDAPFPSGLYQGGGAHVGGDVVVVGTPCGRTSSSDDEANCEGQGLEAAAFNVEDESWRQLDLPASLAGDGATLPPVAHDVGTWDTEAVFSFSVNGTASYQAVDPVRSTWRALVSPPVGFDTVCPIEGDLFAFGLGSVRTQESIISDSPESPGLETLRYDPDQDAWAELPTAIGVSSPFPGIFTCGIDVALFQAPGLTASSVMYFDVGGEGWTLTPPGGLNAYDAGTVAALTEPGFVLWPRADPNVLLLDRGTQSWQRVQKPAPSETAAVLRKAGDQLLVVMPADRSPGRNENATPTLAIMDPTLFFRA